MQERPRSVGVSLQLLGLLLTLGVVTVVLTGVLRDQLVLNWARGHRDAREILMRQGLDYLIDEKPIAVPQFLPVAAVLFVVVAALMGVLAVFYANGHHWARVCLTALLVMTAVATTSGIVVGPPTAFLVLSYLAILVVVLVLVAMWHPATSDYLRATRERVSTGAV